jgi:hypothetical protein
VDLRQPQTENGRLCSGTEPSSVAQAPKNGQQHDIRRELKVVEGRAGSFVEMPVACATEEGSVLSELSPR